MIGDVVIADLFCGGGGAAKGLHQAGFTVIGYDIKPQPHYPFEFHQQDALTVDLSQFDAIWASPPCQLWVDPNSGHSDRTPPDLVTPIRERILAVGLPYIIENVDRAPLRDPVKLCGTMFGLPLIRHRLFESNKPLSKGNLTCKPLGQGLGGYIRSSIWTWGKRATEGQRQ